MLIHKNSIETMLISQWHNGQQGRTVNSRCTRDKEPLQGAR